jgi:hypothetical protein
VAWVLNFMAVIASGAMFVGGVTASRVWPSYGLPGRAVACSTNISPGGVCGDQGFNAELTGR